MNNDGLPDSFPNSDDLDANSPCAPQIDQLGDATQLNQTAYDFCGLSTTVHHDAADSRGQGLRFLRSISNGRGAVVRFTYGSSGEAALVQREPGSLVPTPFGWCRT